MRDALMRFVGLLYSILTLGVAWKLFEHFKNATWYKPTNCRVDGDKVSDLEFMRRHRSSSAGCGGMPSLCDGGSIVGDRAPMIRKSREKMALGDGYETCSAVNPWLVRRGCTRQPHRISKVAF